MGATGSALKGIGRVPRNCQRRQEKGSGGEREPHPYYRCRFVLAEFEFVPWERWVSSFVESL